jgi:hypothetical protein
MSIEERIAKSASGLICVAAIAAVVAFTGSPAAAKKGPFPPPGAPTVEERIAAIEKRIDEMQKRLEVIPSLRVPKPDTRPLVKMEEFVPLFLANKPTLEPDENEWDQKNPKMKKFYQWAKPWVDYRKVQNWPCEFVTTEGVKGEVYSAQVTFDGPTGKAYGIVMLSTDLGDVTPWFEKFKRGKKLILVDAKLCGVGVLAINFCGGRFSDPDERAKGHK